MRRMATILCVAWLCAGANPAPLAQPRSAQLVPVTIDNFIRAESDTYMAGLLKDSGGLAKWNHRREVAAIECIDADLDLRAERFQSEAVFLPALLECAQGVTDGFAGILVFAGFDHGHHPLGSQRGLAVSCSGRGWRRHDRDNQPAIRRQGMDGRGAAGTPLVTPCLPYQ